MIYGSGSKTTPILYIDTKLRLSAWIPSTCPGERSTATYCVGVLASPTACLNVVTKRKIPTPDVHPVPNHFTDR
jgi:hypothetical protein